MVAEEPLLQVALLDRRAAAPAAAVGALDLLARQRAVVGAPVDRRLRAIGQAGLQEAQEQPLVPAVVVGSAVTTSASQSNVAPIVRNWRRMFSMFAIVQLNGWTPLLIAAFSAGRPKASKPIGKNTL